MMMIVNHKLNKSNIGKALNMSVKEKSISFLNNYFIFKKVRNPNAQYFSSFEHYR